MELIISSDGTVRCVYGEALCLQAIGLTEIERASDVEPDSAGRWWADLSPVQGPRLGPFDRRTAALAAEATWLSQHWLTSSSPIIQPRTLHESTPRSAPDQRFTGNHRLSGSALCDLPPGILPTPERNPPPCGR